MENMNTDPQDSSDPERFEIVSSLPNQTSSSFYDINPFNSDFDYEEPLSFNVSQAITSNPFFDQSSGVSYGTFFTLRCFTDHQLIIVLGINDQLYAESCEVIPTSGKVITCGYILLVLLSDFLTLASLNSYRVAPIQPCVDISCSVRR